MATVFTVAINFDCRKAKREILCVLYVKALFLTL